MLKGRRQGRAVREASRQFDGREENGMREEKEIREALKRLKDEHLRIIRDPWRIKYTQQSVAMIGALEWVLGDKERLPDFS